MLSLKNTILFSTLFVIQKYLWSVSAGGVVSYMYKGEVKENEKRAKPAIIMSEMHKIRTMLSDISPYSMEVSSTLIRYLGSFLNDTGTDLDKLTRLKKMKKFASFLAVKRDTGTMEIVNLVLPKMSACDLRSLIEDKEDYEKFIYKVAKMAAKNFRDPRSPLIMEALAVVREDKLKELGQTVNELNKNVKKQKKLTEILMEIN